MSNSRHDPRNRQRPVAPRKKSVYLRRRIIALVVLAVLVAIVWSLVAAAIGFVQGIFGGNSSSTVGANSGGTVAACTADSISLEPIVADSSGSAKSAFSGDNPYFGYRLTNVGSKDCTFDVGAKNTYYRVTSGSETIWTSENCDRTSLVSSVITVKPNEPLTSPLSAWYRVKSSSTGCGAEQTPATAGGASYHLSVEVGGEVSKDTSQFILN
jgi:hypothetical protein